MEHNPVIDRIQASPTMLLNQRAKAMVREGKSIVNLTTGELDFPTPERIKKAAIRALDENKTYYTESAGIPELRAKIAAVAQETYGRAFKSAEVMVTSGAKQALFNSMFSILKPGDEVILLAPYWGSYAEMILLCQGTVVPVMSTFEQGYIPSLKDVEAAITPRTRMILLNSPNNPTGALLPKEWFDGLAEVLMRHPRVMVLTDDIYQRLIYDDKPFHSFAMQKHFPSDRIVVVHGASKTYSMTGWRLGWALAHPDLVSMMVKVQSQSTSNATSISQYAALEALEEKPGEIPGMLQKLSQRREHVYAALKRIEGLRVFYPQGAFYFWMDVSPWMKRFGDDVTLATHLIENCGLALVPGSAFGAKDHLRISFAAAEPVLMDGVDRLEKGLL